MYWSEMPNVYAINSYCILQNITAFIVKIGKREPCIQFKNKMVYLIKKHQKLASPKNIFKHTNKTQ